MIDTPPPPLSVEEQRLEQRLVGCGLPSGGFSIRYEEEWQGLEVTIFSRANVAEESFPCIADAADAAFISFEDQQLGRAFVSFEIESFRPQMIASATAEMTRLGLLEGMPKRASYPDLTSYAEALERHSGVVPRSALRVSGDAILFDPLLKPESTEFLAMYEKVMAAMGYASATGDFENFLFVGNAASTPSSPNP